MWKIRICWLFIFGFTKYNWYALFGKCISLFKNINFSNIKTKKLENISCLFWNCESLENINLSYFNTDNIKDMSNLFSGCEGPLN